MLAVFGAAVTFVEIGASERSFANRLMSGGG